MDKSLETLLQYAGYGGILVIGSVVGTTLAMGGAAAVMAAHNYSIAHREWMNLDSGVRSTVLEPTYRESYRSIFPLSKERGEDPIDRIRRVAQANRLFEQQPLS